MNAPAELKIVTFTGADEQNDLGELFGFLDQYPIAELAILFDPKLAGAKPNYPARQWLEEFKRAAMARGHGKQIALHLCEDSIHQFLDNDTNVSYLAQGFGRVQLNIWQGRMQIDPRKADRAAYAFRQATGGAIIVPMNKGNAPLVTALTDPDVQILFDRSGGQGKTPDEWPEGLADRFCGWAGGLGPDNIVHEYARIQAKAKGPHGIDMETNVQDVREEGKRLSLPKCADVLRKLGHEPQFSA